MKNYCQKVLLGEAHFFRASRSAERNLVATVQIDTRTTKTHVTFAAMLQAHFVAFVATHANFHIQAVQLFARAVTPTGNAEAFQIFVVLANAHVFVDCHGCAWVVVWLGWWGWARLLGLWFLTSMHQKFRSCLLEPNASSSL